jgi:Fe2+ transport system protein B
MIVFILAYVTCFATLAALETMAREMSSAAPEPFPWLSTIVLPIVPAFLLWFIILGVLSLL